MYVDANIFIYATAANDQKGAAAANILQEIEEGASAITSSLTLDEVMWWFIKNDKADDLKAAIQEIYELTNLEVKDTPALIPLQALDLIEQHNLKPRDAIHAATMKHYGQTHIASEDTDFDRIPGIKRIGI